MGNTGKTSSNVIIYNMLGKYPIITVHIGVQTYITIHHYGTNYLVEPIDGTNHNLNESHLAPEYPRVITFPVN